mmetsp:Transcript_82904/g.173588  ORF Transcript_82904/g.173588 Transcript_82904/m.173588 type:complete len:461 (-) Transcript_82904:68-1450(-)|eukprot:CAMPEP_0206450710 /NCGR_PEP_ID=MMETSP0324_2-20121206/18892_1 /ASSEMBLY_ACC=CAM_ASM_000836 /TAXON_ID=2866 /ORGANISM="Crypthecodinium cohnii, Strain Seligo" /LENGTH=460 /DNA_ID=CAMNT_0053920421 /DNA_START=189 /DNA_END=1571 /DNA_ORIENTATION=+
MAETGEKPGSGEALVSFTTKLPDKYQVQDDSLVVPASLKRFGLSEVVNRLLGFEKPVPFDFLVNGEFLRVDLYTYLESHKLSSEQVLKLEYVLALSEPEEHQVDEVPDWISGLATLGPLPCSWYIASSYDGGVRIYNDSKPKLTTALSPASLTSVRAMAVPESEGKASLVATGCKDGVVRCFRSALTKSEAFLGPIATLRSKEHRQSVEAVAISHDGNLVAGGGWDGDVLIWNGGPSVFEEPVSGQATSSGATKRKAESGPDLESAKYGLKGHGQVVSALAYGAPARYPFTLLSASWDGSLRVWDTAAAACVCNWSVARAVTSFSFNPTDPQIATSHEDGHVSIWDVRAAPHATVAGGLSLDSSTGLPLASAQSPHRRQATEVVWCPADSLRLATVGHDGGLCILDARSPKMPLQRVRLGKAGPIPTKLLCVTWLSREELAVGTSEGKVLRLLLNKSKED